MASGGLALQRAEDRFAERDEVDLSVVIATLRRSRWAAFVGAILAALIELARLHGEAPTYLVQMDVLPVIAASAVMADRAASPPQRFVQPTPDTTKSATLFNVYLQSLRSRAVADELATCQAVMKTLFRTQWDGAQNRWREHTGTFDRMRRVLQTALGWPAAAWQPPGGAQMQKFLGRNLVVRRNLKEHDFATVELETSQPEIAQWVLVLLNQAANDRLRPAAMSGKSPRGSTLPPGGPAKSGALAGCEMQSQPQFAISAPDDISDPVADPVAAQLLGAPSIRPDPTNTPLKSVLTALLLGAAAGVACRLATRRLTTRRYAQGVGDDTDRSRHDTVA